MSLSYQFIPRFIYGFLTLRGLNNICGIDIVVGNIPLFEMASSGEKRKTDSGSEGEDAKKKKTEDGDGKMFPKQKKQNISQALEPN